MEEEKESHGAAADDECEDDVAAVSMVDILEEEEKLQEDADAVLGGSDDRNCTYQTGYVSRQALYSCRTCAANSNELAGVCLACSLECHDGHELIELYTKRNFRCDCGNSKFTEFTCKLYPNKLPCNPDNKYNHNYIGLYCTCSRPYPDPDDSIDDEMIQCIICEDWFHKRHLDNSAVEDEYDEMICGLCMNSFRFLWCYARFCKAFYKKLPMTETVHETKVDVDSEEKKAGDISADDSAAVSSSTGMSSMTLTPPKENSLGNVLNQLPEMRHLTEVCHLNQLESDSTSELNGAVFWPENWRRQLCQCAKCIEVYRDLNILFLLDKNDTIAAYEESGKSKVCKTSYQQGLEALSKLDRIHQVDLIQEYNDLKSQLTEYLKKFAENKKVVRQEDVDEFFSQLTARKRQKAESLPSQSYYCK